MITDTLARPLHDLRISVTDRCNFRCLYCMPKEVFGREYEFLPPGEVLHFEEIARVARLLTARGVEKIRLTGGEPLVRRGLEELVAMLVSVPGLRDLTLTTNGSLLAGKAVALRKAGLHRISVSLDSLDDGVFRRMNDVDFPVSRVLDGIDAALAAGFAPIKINMVVRRGLNEHTVVEMARYFKRPETILRLIEYMDVGSTNGWRMDDVVPAAELVGMVAREMPLEPIGSNYRGEVAKRYRHADGTAEIGIIGSVTMPFCGDCSRLRLSADGKLYTCLFASAGNDLRSRLRSGSPDSEIADFIAGVWQARSDRYSELRTVATSGGTRVEMSRIGG